MAFCLLFVIGHLMAQTDEFETCMKKYCLLDFFKGAR